VVFTVDKECQLMGVGLCATEGAYTADLVLMEVDPEDYNMELRKVAESAQSFTRNDMNDHQIVRMMLGVPALISPGKHYMISAHIKVTHCPVSLCKGSQKSLAALTVWLLTFFMMRV
jgi:hypothetical protein